MDNMEQYNSVELMKVRGELVQDKNAIVFGGRFEEIFKPTIMSYLDHYPLVEIIKAINIEIRQSMVKFFRLSHHPVGKRGDIHQIANVVITGDYAVGLTRDDGRKLKYEVGKEYSRDWYQLKCNTPGCKGVLRISSEGKAVLFGIIEIFDGNQWIACKDLPNCAII